VGDLDGHVPEPAEADDGDLLAGTSTPVVQGRVRGDAGTQQRGRDVEAEAVEDAKDEAFGDDDVGGVAALGELAVLAGDAVGADVALDAELLFTCLAVAALAAGVDHAADADPVADCVPGDLVADLGDLGDRLSIPDRYSEDLLVGVQVEASDASVSVPLAVTKGLATEDSR